MYSKIQITLLYALLLREIAQITSFSYFSAITQVMKHGAARFRAFGNIADVLMKMEKSEEAVAVYQKQLALSKQSRDKRFEANAFGSLGICHRLSKQLDKALGYHTQVNIKKTIILLGLADNERFV